MGPPLNQRLLAGFGRKNCHIYPIVIHDYGRDEEKLVGNPEWVEETSVDDNLARHFGDAGGGDLRGKLVEACKRIWFSEDRTAQVVSVTVVEIGDGNSVIAVVPSAHRQVSFCHQNQITIQSPGVINFPPAKYGRFESMVSAEFING